MARQDVDIGVEGNDGTGDSIRESFRKVNENFTELYAVFGVEGSLSFTSLSDTPNVYEGNKVLTTNATGDAVIFSTITSTDGTIGIDVITTPGQIDLSVAAVKLVDDTVAPTLGNHLSAANFAIGGVAISEAAAAAINSQTGRSTAYTIDDLVITKGYADRRYVTSGLPIRVAREPESTLHYRLVVTGYTGNGHLVISQHYDLETQTYQVGHGLDSGANGTAYIFNADNVDPNGLTTGQTYYIRYESSTELSLFSEKSFAMAESDSVADPEKILVSGTIAVDDIHSIVDAGYNEELLGNFLEDVAMPRESVTRRQGDKMEGALYLHDHPGDLAGSGSPNGLEDLQAATKYYVDNTAYSSPEVLFVSTAGDDTMQGVPAGKEGTAATYAYRTINAAARRATELVSTAPEEPGPYFQTLSYGATDNTAGTAATVISAGVESANNVDTRNIIVNNKQFLIKEITGYLAFTYPDFAYNIELCERDLGLILDAVSIDALRGNTANYLSRTAAERYYSSVSGRIAITSQLERTDDSFATLLEILQTVLQNKLYNPKTISNITKATPGNTALAIESPALVTTATEHGLRNGNLVIFKDIAGMVEIEDQILYVKVVNSTSFELFSDAELSTPFDNRTYTSFVAGVGQIGLRYQDKLNQDESVSPLTPTDNGYVAVTQNFSLIRNIIRNGVGAGADVAFGNRYALEMTNSTSGILDQTNPDNIDALPGKVIRGKRSGAIGRIITYTQDTNSTTFFLQPLEPKDFDPGEELEMGNYVKNKQIVIRVEAGFYEEDYPIKLTKNVSLKGDEFRRVIVRPKRRVSQSEFANTYFYRDKEFDGNILLTTGVPFINQTGDLQGYFGYHYLKDNTKPANVGSPIVNVGKYRKAANILELNRSFIQEEVGEYAQTTYPTLFSTVSRDKCERDVGLIVDAIVKDLKRGGEEFTLEAQGEYYSGAVLTPGTDAETADSIAYISALASDLLRGVAPATIRGTVEVDLDVGAAENEWAVGVAYTQGEFVKKTVGLDTFYYRALTTHVSVATDEDTEPTSLTYLRLNNSARWEEVSGSIALVGELVDKINFAFDPAYNPPKRNDADGMDVFLMDDATIVRNVTVQGHGGFMCVLDPTGQVLTKSPYIQTATSFSRSRNAKAFSGGMFVDAFAGNIPMRVLQNSGTYTDSAGSVGLDQYTIYVESQDVGGQAQGLKLRLPQLPAPFYFEGQRYQVNAISNYDSGTGRAVLYLDRNSNSGNGWNKTGTDNIGDPGHDASDVEQDIFLQTAGYRSILSNDFTQINDLGYGLVTTNGAFAEAVSMFTYYTHAAYYAANGSEIRSLNGSNGYGFFGLVAEGANPNEIPDEVRTLRSSVQPIKAFTYGGFTNAKDDTSVTVYDFKEKPMSNSYIWIDHPTAGPLNYRISRVENLADPNNDGTVGSAGSIVVTGIETVNNSSITGSSPGGNSTWTNVPQKSSTGAGLGAEFTITITAGVPSFTVTNVGQGYAPGNTVTISGADIGGATPANDLTIPVTATFATTPGTYTDAPQTGTITAATTANPTVITSPSHGLVSGDRIKIDNVSGMAELNGNRYYVQVLTSNTFALYTNESLFNTVNSTEYTPYAGGGGWYKEGGIGNYVFRLTLQEAGSNNDYYGVLQEAVLHGTLMDYRYGENFLFTGVANPNGIKERPSTAINFDESDLDTYRSTGFTQFDDQNQGLGSDEIKATFDATFSSPIINVSYPNIGIADPDNGSKTLGATIGDSKIAVEKLDAKTAARIIQDATDATNQDILLPGDPGYSGGMIFSFNGKVLQVIDYAPVTTGTVTNITQADPAVVTSTAHGLSNGASIEFYKLGGMTNLNGATFFVGNVTANTFELYSDSGLSSSVDTSAFNAYTSGGFWAGSNSVWYIDTQDYQVDGVDWDISGTSANSGIKSPVTSDRELYLGIPAGTTAEITVAISLLRATGHDFTQIGTGGFNTSNYPNVLLGQPVEAKAGAYTDASDASKAQVWERRKGRVFFITSDEDGFFRVGKYFEVDQSTGSITFAGEVGISRAASLGFKDGVTINEFSNDELFTDLSDTAVPTEKAIANYVSRRLGHNGQIQLTGSSRFAPGFMALDGSTKMEANLNMNSKQIKNLLDPVDDNDATTKDYVVQATQAYDEFDDLRNVTIHDRTGTSDQQKQILVPTGYQRLTVEPQTGSIVAGDLLEDGSSTGVVIAVESRFDYSLNKNVQIITYDLKTGTGFNTTLSPVFVGSLGTKAAAVLENPVEEFTNAREDSSSDINITVNRTTTDTTINLQIESQSILNSDINDDAGISQSKLMMNRAKPVSSSAGLFGTDGDGGISIPKTITAISKANPGLVTTSTPHNLGDGELVQLSDIGGMVELNGNSYYSKVVNSTQFTLYANSGLSTPVSTISFTTYTSGGSVAGEATGSGRTGQSSRGVAAFEVGSFAEDVELTFDDFVVVNAGDVIIQGTNRGYATASYGGSGSLTVVVRTDDTFTVSSTPVQRAAVVNGVEGTPVNLVDGGGGTVFVSGVKRSGYISLHDRGVAFSKLPNLTGGNTGDVYGGSVIGRATDGTGVSQEVSFATVINQGRGLADGDFTTERGYWSNPPTNTVVNNPGSALIQYGTAGGGTYAYTTIAYDNANNSLVKRNNAGKIQATSLIIGGVGTYEILSESNATLNFKTPEQGTILTASGTSKPTINTGGVIRVGDIAAYSESTFHAASNWGTGQSSPEVSALAARWIYSSFIEAPGEKDASSTGIGIGAGTGFSDGGADKITHVTGGAVRTITSDSGLEVKGNITTTGSIIMNSSGNITYEGTDNAFETTVQFTDPTADRTITIPNANGTLVVSAGTSTTQSGLDLAISAAGQVSGSAEGLATTDSPTFAGMTISNTNTLTVRAITTGAAATTGTITGTWSLGTGSKFQATYADLAENYEADAEYEIGTVVVFGGEKEITQSTEHRSTRIAGVVSENPAYLMNAECPGIATAIALQGRVPVKVIGKVRKGDMLVASAIPGYAIVDNDPKVGSVIGKAVGEKLDGDKGLVEVVVGRL